MTRWSSNLSKASHEVVLGAGAWEVVGLDAASDEHLAGGQHREGASDHPLFCVASIHCHRHLALKVKLSQLDLSGIWLIGRQMNKDKIKVEFNEIF